MKEPISINDPDVIRWVATQALDGAAPADISALGDRATTVAVVGLSPDPARPSHGVARSLQEYGYKIVPVNPNLEAVLGEKAYPHLASVPGPVDVVQVFRRAEHTPAVAKDAAAEAKRLGIRVFWLQEGIVSHEAAQIALDAGLHVVMDRCLYKEIRRLMAERG